MNNELNNSQDGNAKSFGDEPANTCAVCQQNPCVCPSNGSSTLQENTDQNTRTKGSHRKGKPPELKWL